MIAFGFKVVDEDRGSWAFTENESLYVQYKIGRWVSPDPDLHAIGYDLLFFQRLRDAWPLYGYPIYLCLARDPHLPTVKGALIPTKKMILQDNTRLTESWLKGSWMAPQIMLLFRLPRRIKWLTPRS